MKFLIQQTPFNGEIEDDDLMILVESKRMLSSSLEPIRSQISTMSTKIGEKEDSLYVVKRAMRQELGTYLEELCGGDEKRIDELLDEIKIAPRMLHWRLPENRTEQSDSTSYPGLLTRYQLHYIRISVPWLPSSAFVTNQFRHKSSEGPRWSVQHWWSYIPLSRVIPMLRRDRKSKNNQSELLRRHLSGRLSSHSGGSRAGSSEYSDSIKSDIESLVDDLNATWSSIRDTTSKSSRHNRDEMLLMERSGMSSKNTMKERIGRRVIFDLYESSEGIVTFTSLCRAFRRWGYLKCSRPYVL